jgi:hypothetical protein
VWRGSTTSPLSQIPFRTSLRVWTSLRFGLAKIPRPSKTPVARPLPGVWFSSPNSGALGLGWRRRVSSCPRTAGQFTVCGRTTVTGVFYAFTILDRTKLSPVQGPLLNTVTSRGSMIQLPLLQTLPMELSFLRTRALVLILSSRISRGMNCWITVSLSLLA